MGDLIVLCKECRGSPVTVAITTLDVNMEARVRLPIVTVADVDHNKPVFSASEG